MKKQRLADIAVAAVEESAAANAPRESCEVKEQKDECILIYHGEKIETVEQLLVSAGIDMRLWEISEQSINNWEVAGKRRMGQDSGRRWRADQLWKTGLRQIKVKLRRLAPKPIQDAIKDLMKDVRPIATATPPKRKASSDRHMMEMGIYDHHWGKLAWGKETGTDWDLNIADREWRSASDEMLSRSAGFNVEKIVFPIGNDFFHVNNFNSTTANDTRVDSTDDRFSKVFRSGCKSVQYSIERCLEIAPVQIVFVPGNHDRHTAWYLTEWIAGVFANNKHVIVDNSPRERKYLSYGPALLGYTHGDETPPDRLPGLMAVEASQQWAASTFRSWRIGHWHKRKETRYNVGDTFEGVEVRIFPSLCGTDGWHYRKGFIGNSRMAECHFWSRKSGLDGYFVTHAKGTVAV